MIKEAFCSKEVSKLLKEKGFNELVHHEYHYIIDIPQFHKKKHNFNGIEYRNCSSEWYSAPTHQMAMAWLRKTHKLFIEIHIEQGEKVSYKFMIWDFYVIHPNKYVGGTYDLREEQKGFSTPEQAIETALKYSLENLI